MTTTESAIMSGVLGDLYVVLGEELSDGRASIRAYYIPLVNWIWAGWIVIIFGSVFALTQSRASEAKRLTPCTPAIAVTP